MNAATPLAGLAKPPVQPPNMSGATPVPPPRTTRPMGPVSTGVAASAVSAAPRPAKPAGWGSPGLWGPSSDNFHSRSGITTEHPVFSAASFGDTSRMTDDQKTQLANATMDAGGRSGVRGYHSDWSGMKARDNADGMHTDFSRTRELQGGLAPDPRTGKLVDAGSSSIGQVTQHDSVNGAAHPAIDGAKTYMSIDTPYGKGTTADVGSKAHNLYRQQSGNAPLAPGTHSLTDNGVTTTGPNAFQAQLSPMQQQQAQKFVQDQKMNNPSVFGDQLPPGYGSMSNGSKQEYWNNAPKAPYNDGMAQHPALTLPQSVQNGASNLTQSNLPAAAPQAPGAGLAKPPPAVAGKPGAPPASAPPPPLPPPPGVAGAAPVDPHLTPGTPEYTEKENLINSTISSSQAAGHLTAPGAYPPSPGGATNTAMNNPVPKPAAPALPPAPAAPSTNTAMNNPVPKPAAPALPPAPAAPPAAAPATPGAPVASTAPAPATPAAPAAAVRAANDWRTPPLSTNNDWRTHRSAPAPAVGSAAPSPAWMGRTAPTEAAGMGNINPNLLPGINATPKTPPVGMSTLPAMHPIA